MDVVTLIIAAEDEEYSAVGESSSPLNEWSGIETRGLDTIKIALLHSMLTGDTLQRSLERYEPIYESENEILTLRIADDLLDRLCALNEESFDAVARELAASEEFEREQWELDTVLGQLIELAELAQLAESQGQALFVWMRLDQS